MNRKNYIILIGILVIHLLLLMVLKFTAWPEMTLWPYLMAKGWLPYTNIAIAHNPLMLIDLAIFYKIFGTGIMQLKIFTWGLILASDVLIFFVVKKLWNIKTALTALMFYIPWMLFYDGNGLWFDLYMGVLAFCSFYFVRKRKWFWGGFFWALAFISKQTAVWFILPILWAMVNGKWLMVKGRAIKFTSGVIVILATFILLLFTFHLLPSFYDWAIKFGIFILPKAQGQVQLPEIKTLIVAGFPFLIFIPLILKTGKKHISLLFWALAGVLGAYPRFEFFHLQPAVPFLAIATAGFFTNRIWKNPLIKIFTTLYLVGCIGVFGGFFMRNFKEGTRFYEKNVTDVVSFVKYNTQKGDRIFVLNWWDNIYALTETVPSVNPWVPQLSWYMEIPGIQEKMVNDLAVNPPKLIVFSPYTKLGLSAYIPEKVYNYIIENYKLSQRVDGVEILTHD